MYYFVFGTDIDECSTNSHGCSQVCINTDGSYNCSCHDGYLKQFRYFCFGNKIGILSVYYFCGIQILMSVLILIFTIVWVIKCVRIQWEASGVLAEKDLNLAVMAQHVNVS